MLMTKTLDDILKIIHEEIDLANEKIVGISLLESLKFKVISKLSIIENQIAKLDNLESNIFSELEQNHNRIQINFDFNKESTSHLKKKIPIDTLFLVLKGRITLDLIGEKKINNSAKINIFTFMGICLSSQTIINLNTFKNTFFIKLTNLNSDSNIENSKKDII